MSFAWVDLLKMSLPRSGLWHYSQHQSQRACPNLTHSPQNNTHLLTNKWPSQFAASYLLFKYRINMILSTTVLFLPLNIPINKTWMILHFYSIELKCNDTPNNIHIYMNKFQINVKKHSIKSQKKQRAKLF